MDIKMYKVKYLDSRTENNKTIYNLRSREFAYKREAQSFIESIGRRFVQLRYNTQVKENNPVLNLYKQQDN